MHLVGIRRFSWEKQCVSCQEFWDNAFPERMGISANETHRPLGIASLSREHDQLLTLTLGQGRAAH